MTDHEILDTLEKIEITNNSVLVLRMNREYLSQNEAQKILSSISSLHEDFKKRDVAFSLLVIPTSFQIESLSEEQMEKLGWVRKEPLDKVS